MENVNQNRTVSVIIPCLNEEKYIARCLDSLLANNYDQTLIDIIVVDGMSRDKTRDILSEYCNKYNFLKVLDNPKQITPIALNMAIRASKADIILRADAHSIYAENYISTLVNGLDKYQADNIGGIRETELIRDTPMTHALSIAIFHPFAVANAYYRVGSNRIREVDTVFCGCFRRALFDKVGYFNENIVRTEDRDFNARIRENGGRIILDPSTRCTYYPRIKVWDYCKWNVYGPYRLFYNHKYTNISMVSWRNFIPGAFFLTHFIAVLMFLISPFLGMIFALPIVVYCLVSLSLSIKEALKYRSVGLVPTMFFVFALTHYGYAVGSLMGMPYYLFQRIINIKNQLFNTKVKMA